MLNPYSKLYSFMLKDFENMLTCIYQLSPVLVQCSTSLAQPATSQTESRKPLKSALIVIMPKYLFEINGFGINLVNLTMEKYYIYDKLGFGTLPVTSQDPFPAL